MQTIKLRKGLEIPLKGEAERVLRKVLTPKLVAVRPGNFKNIVPKLVVQEGAYVRGGDILFTDKANPRIRFCAPCSGTIKGIVRGEKRKLLAVEILSDGKGKTVEYKPLSAEATREEVTERLLESGLWSAIIQRPYGIIANPDDTPKAIVISAFNSAPLSADINFTLKGEEKNIQIAIDALSKFTKKIFVNLPYNNATESPLAPLKGVTHTAFKGPHPAGNVGVQIAHLCPIGKGDVVWSVQPQLLSAIGKVIKGVYDLGRVIAVAGVENPAYIKCLPGTCMNEIVEAFPITKEKKLYGQECRIRYISGNPLLGETVGEAGYLGFYDDTVTLIYEGSYREFLGWAKIIRPKKFSLSRTYFSWLTPRRKYSADSNLNGGVRPFVVTGLYEKVLPMDIYPVYLLKAILAEDIEKMEQLGIYEVTGEDFALCDYVCPSKINASEIIEQGIRLMLKEMV